MASFWVCFCLLVLRKKRKALFPQHQQTETYSALLVKYIKRGTDMDTELRALMDLSREEILQIFPGKYGDYELLDLADFFDGENDRDREAAVYEIILKSPLNDEMLSYSELYDEVFYYYQNNRDTAASLQWAVANILFEEQNEREADAIIESWRMLGEAYLRSGELETGLILFTRLISRNPGDIWNYNTLVLSLLSAHMGKLAIDVIDRVLMLFEKFDPDNLKKQFLDLRSNAQEELSKEPGQDLSINPEILKNFRAALALPAGESSDLEEEKELGHLYPIASLVNSGEAVDPALEAELRKYGRGLIPELIHLATDKDLVTLEDYGPRHAARLLDEMREGSALELEMIASWLERTRKKDWLAWISVDKIGKYYRYSYEELEAIARDSRYEVVVRNHAVEDLTDSLEKNPEIRPRLIMLMRDLLNRDDADSSPKQEIFTAFLISSAMDINASELGDDIVRAYEEDRVDQSIVDYESARDELGLPVLPKAEPPEGSIRLNIRCLSCDRVREQYTKFVVIDNTQDSAEPIDDRGPFILDHEFVCPKCGVKERYTIDSLSMFRLFQLKPEDMMVVMLDKQLDKRPKTIPQVYFASITAFDQPMHPLDIVDEYRRRSVQEPRNGDNYLYLGNALRVIGRYEQSLEAYHKAVELQPEDEDILLIAATAEHDYGDLEEAKRLYEQCAKKRISFAKGLSEAAVIAVQGLHALEKGKMSEWEYSIKNSKGQPLIPPRRQFSQNVEKKDKRAKRHKKRGK
jgi:hypothetical protein